MMIPATKQPPIKKVVARPEQIRFLQNQLKAGLAWAEFALELERDGVTTVVHQRYARILHDSVVSSLTLVNIPEEHCRLVHAGLCFLWLALNELGEWDETYLLRLRINSNLSYCQN